MPRRGAILQTFVVCFATAAVALLQQWPNGPLARAELAAADIATRLGRKADPDPSLVFLAIDNASVAQDREIDLADYGLDGADPNSARALELMTDAWPWSREVYALVLERLMAAGAKVVIFDLLFPKEGEGDARFEEQLHQHRDHVVVAANFVADAERGLDTQGVTFATPTGSLIPNTSPRDDRIGFDNYFPDIDSVVRAAHYRLALQEAYDESAFDDEREWSLAARAAIKSRAAVRIPNDSTPYRLRFAGAAGAFPPRSIYQIFVPHMWRQNFAGGAFFRDKIVMIGASGNWQHDQHLTPFGTMPGAEVHLNALNALLTGAFIQENGLGARILLTGAAGCAAWLLWLGLRRPLLRFLALLAGGTAWLVVILLLLNSVSLLVPIVAPLCVFAISGVSGLLNDIIAERREKNRVRHTLERYVSRNIVQQMMDNPAAFQETLGGVVKPATVLFSDIRNFTQASARTEPHALVAQLNEYLTAMVDCVFRHDGTLDKFIGDAVMAVWGNVRSDGAVADALQAVRCALAMREELHTLNARWRAQGRNQLEVGIALNHGNVLVGNIGSPQRMEFAVIGDAVNLSWKLQERTKLHSCELLLGKSVADLIATEFQTHEVGILQVAEGVATRYSRLLINDRAPADSRECASTTCKNLNHLEKAADPVL